MNTDELVLASKSISRRTMLERAGVPFRWIDTNIDEAAIKDRCLAEGAAPADIALRLAKTKAEVGASKMPDNLVLGCDQILVCDDAIFDKPENLEQAANHLRSFRSRTHQLVAAAVLIFGEHEVWSTVDVASLEMRDISDAFIDAYLASEGERVLTSVGAYRLEGLGIQLFRQIEGDHSTILGLPMLPLLEELRKQGILRT